MGNYKFNPTKLFEKLNTPLARSIITEVSDIGTTLLGANLTSGVEGEMNPVARKLMQEHGPINGIITHELTRMIPFMYGGPGIIYLLENKLGDKIQQPSLSMMGGMMKNHTISDLALDAFALYKLTAILHNVGSLTYQKVPEPWNEVAALVSGLAITAPHLKSLVKHYRQKSGEFFTDYSVSKYFDDVDFSTQRKIREGFNGARKEAIKKGLKPFPNGDDGLLLYHYFIRTASELEKKIANESDERKMFELELGLNKIYGILDGTSSPYDQSTTKREKLLEIYNRCKGLESNSRFD